MAAALPAHLPMLPRPESAAGRKLSKSSSLSSIKNGSFSWRGLLRLKTKQRAEDSDYDTSDEASSVGSPLTPVPENGGSHADFKTTPSLPPLQMAAQRRTTFTKRVRRVFSSSSIAKQQQQLQSPLQSVDPHSDLGPYTPKPISRIHSSPDSYTPAPPGGGPGDKSSVAAQLGLCSAPTASRLEVDRRAIQAQLSQSVASIGSGTRSHSPSSPHHPHSFSSPSPLNSSAHRGQSSISSRPPAYSSSSGSRPTLNRPHLPVPSGNHPLPGSKRMTRKPMLHFHHDTLGLPVAMTNMPLPTPPPPSHAKESRFDLSIPSSSLASPGLSTGSGLGPHSLLSTSASYGPSHPLSLQTIDLSLMPDEYSRRYRPRSTLPTPVASPIPPPASAQRSLHSKSVAAQWATGPAAPSLIPSPSSASALTPPLPIRNLLSTPPGSPADDAHAALAPPKRPSQLQRGTSLPPSASTDALKAEVIARIRQMAVDSSDKDLTPPPSPPQSATTTTSAIPAVGAERYSKAHNVSLAPAYTAPSSTRISFTSSDKDVPLPASGAVPQFDETALVYPPVTPCTSTESEPERAAEMGTADGAYSHRSSSPPSLASMTPELARGSKLDNHRGESLSPPSVTSSSSTESALVTPPMSQTSSASTTTAAAAVVGQGGNSGRASAKGGNRGIDRQLRFAETVLIYETFDASFYDRRGEAMIRLTPEIAFQIKTELNNFKMYELEVHEDSRQFTHFIP
ncbi:bud neck involved protein [Dimargaris xerosporica]|nr:bud neck involved protein [Dimargaris xerosporica]